MAKTPDQYNANAPVAKPDGSAAPFFVQQWNLLLSFVKDSLASVSEIVALIGVVRAEAVAAQASAVAAAAAAAAASAPTGVVAGSYTNTALTVGADGRLTAASSGAGGATDWNLVASTDFGTSPVTNWDVTGLAAYTDILVIIVNTTLSGGSFRALQVSTNNGVSFFNTNGDYADVPPSGILGVNSGYGFEGTGTAPAKSGDVMISGFKLAGVPKVGVTNQSTRFFLATLAALNAVRVTTVSPGGMTINGGQAYVLAR